MTAIPKPKHYCKCGCGTEIRATRKWVSGHNFKRRPKDAVVKNGRTYRTVKCSECGERFEKRADQINRRSLVNLCGSKCISVYQSRTRLGKENPKAKTGSFKECHKCGERYYVQRSYVNSSKFCSRKCFNDWQIETGYVPKKLISSSNNKGKRNGMYKSGKHVRNGYPSKIKIRKKVIERDGGNWCLFCGKPGPGLHLHRIVYGSQGGKYEPSNCVQLCAEHHAIVHSNKNKWMPLLLEHVKKRKFETL